MAAFGATPIGSPISIMADGIKKGTDSIIEDQGANLVKGFGEVGDFSGL